MMDFEALLHLVKSNRSTRRFQQAESVSQQDLVELVKLARFSPSSANRQPLRFGLVNQPERNSQVFSTLGLAGYLSSWDGPRDGERPAAYILILGDRERAENVQFDAGIAAQTILLGAAAKGLGGCILGSVQRPALQEILDLDDRYRIVLVLALGVPGEEIVVEEMGDDGDVRYWRDDQGVHHVPKRSLSDLILELPG